MALIGPDGEQLAHLTAREQMRQKVGSHRAEPPALDLPAPKPPDRGRWVGPERGVEQQPAWSEAQADAGLPAPPTPAADEPPASELAAPDDIAMVAMVALAKVMGRPSLTREQKNMLVQAFTIIATLP
jgi:hypothetical protein